MYRKGIIFWFSLILGITGYTQVQPVNPVCGTVGERAEEIIDRFLSNKEGLSRSFPSTRNLTYLPVTFHLVAKDDGLGRVSPGKVLDMICRLNADFTGTELQFYIKKLTLINNTLIYSDHTNAETLMLALRDPHAINVWLLQDATPEGATIENSVVQGYYTSNDQTLDWIVMRRSEANGISTTLTHELGHFFSLAHPFRGWDNEPYDPDIHGEPAPAVSPGGQPTELMSGANCETAADMLCDTPPDYNSGFGWQSCDYNGGAKDPEGLLIDPEERLFMSYFGECERDDYYFSDMQQAIMRQDVESEERTYIREAPTTPDLSPITETIELVAPENTSAVNPADPVTFNWNAVAGADQYLLEIDITPSFVTPLLRQLIVDSNSRTVAGLQPDRTYYWRVRPFNNYHTCTDYSPLRTFTTSAVVSTQEIKGVTEWRLQPNPVRTSGRLHLHLQTEESFSAAVRLFDLSGKPVREFVPTRFPAGSRTTVYQLDGLAAGAYFFSLLAENGGRLIQKIIVIP